MVVELIVGYDLRTVYGTPLERTAAAVETMDPASYQLRIDVSSPLSVSPMIWRRFMPELWWDKEELSFEYSTSLPSRYEEIEALVELLEARACIPIGISVREGARKVRRRFGDDWHTEPRFPLERWKLIGYDVAETGSLLSALACFGWGPGFWAKARPRWAHLANDHNLFDDPEAAREYCTFADDHSIDHGPFFTYGLWLPK